MTKNFTVAALSAAFLLCGGSLGFAQSAATHGTTGSSMSTSPSTSTSMGSSTTAGTTAGSASSELKAPITSESQLKQDLQAKGYSDVTNVTRDGNYYTATAKHGGQSMKLRIDASNGMVTQNPS